MDVVKFTQMKDGDKEDYDFLDGLERDYASGVGERLMDAMASLSETLSGYQVSRLEHSLQAATRAYYDGADTDWIVAALLHDIGDLYAPYNHDEYAATIIAPYVREQCAWVVSKHGAFQMLYYAHHVGANPHARDTYKGHIYFDDCDYFCEHWDQTSFDPNYQSLPLAFFRPYMNEVFSRKVNQPQVIRANERVAMKDRRVALQRAQ